MSSRFCDPTNAACQPVGTVPNSSATSLTPPGANAGGDADWVLILDKG